MLKVQKNYLWILLLKFCPNSEYERDTICQYDKEQRDKKICAEYTEENGKNFASSYSPLKQASPNLTKTYKENPLKDAAAKEEETEREGHKNWYLPRKEEEADVKHRMKTEDNGTVRTRTSRKQKREEEGIRTLFLWEMARFP